MPTTALVPNGLKMAVDDINTAGGVTGKQLKIVFKDDLGDPDKGVQAAKDLIGSGVVAIVGPIWSGVAQAVDKVTCVRLVSRSSHRVPPADLGVATFNRVGFLPHHPCRYLEGKALSKVLIADGQTKVTARAATTHMATGLPTP